MRIYPEFIIMPIVSLALIGTGLYFIIYFAVLSALRKHEETKS